MTRIADFIADDITFCMSECDKKDCFRHMSNVRRPDLPQSYAFFKGTQDCPKGEELNGEIHN